MTCAVTSNHNEATRVYIHILLNIPDFERVFVDARQNHGVGWRPAEIQNGLLKHNTYNVRVRAGSKVDNRGVGANTHSPMSLPVAANAQAIVKAFHRNRLGILFAIYVRMTCDRYTM